MTRAGSGWPRAATPAPLGCVVGLALVALAVLFVSACAGSSTHATRSDVSVVNALGFATFGDYRAFVGALEVPIAEETVACLRSKGLERDVESLVPPGAGQTRAEFVRSLGYGITTVPAPSEVDAPDIGECNDVARRGVLGPFEASMAPLASDLMDVNERLLEHPAIDAAIDRWSTCMRAKGYVFDDPMRIPVSFARSYHPDTRPLSGSALKDLRRREIDAAQADLACQLRHLDDVIEGRRAELEGNIVAREKDRLATARLALVRAARSAGIDPRRFGMTVERRDEGSGGST